MGESIAEVAAHLSPAQRAWLVKQQPILEPVAVVPSEEWWDCPPLYVAIDGIDHWLAQQSMSSPEGASTFTTGETALYPLGLAVFHLISQGADHDC